MDIKDLKQRFYHVYLNEVLTELSEHYAPLESMVEEFTMTKKGMLLRSYLENTKLLNDYVELLCHYDKKIEMNEQHLEKIIETNEEWREHLKKKLKIEGSPTELPKEEAMQYLRTAFSEKRRTHTICSHILKKIDEEKLGNTLRDLGQTIITKISSLANDSPNYGESLYYTTLARLMIKHYIQSVAEDSAGN